MTTANVPTATRPPIMFTRLRYSDIDELEYCVDFVEAKHSAKFDSNFWEVAIADAEGHAWSIVLWENEERRTQTTQLARLLAAGIVPLVKFVAQDLPGDVKGDFYKRLYINPVSLAQLPTPTTLVPTDEIEVMEPSDSSL